MLNSRKRSKVIIIAAIAVLSVLVIGLAASRVFNTGVQTSMRVNRHYVLENATDREKFELMMSVTLYEDGSAVVKNALISSYMPMFDCTYAFEKGKLLIYAKADNAAAGVREGQVIARFTVPDENTIMFESASVPLRVKEGSRYVCTQQEEAAPPVLTLYPGVPADPKAAKPLFQDEEGRYLLDDVITAVVECSWEADITLYFGKAGTDENPVPVPFPLEKDTDMHMLRIDIGDIFPSGYLGCVWAAARDTEGEEHYSRTLDVVYHGSEQEASAQPFKWFDYYLDEEMPWDITLELDLPEYPGTVFQWTPYEVKAVGSGGEKTLYHGMPVWSVYLADLTGDGLPELCSTVSMGSGIVDERIIVCDYSTGRIYELSDRMNYDYVLCLEDGRLMVNQTKHPNPQGEVLAAGELALVDGKLTILP